MLPCVVVEVMLVLVQPTATPKNIMFAETGMMGLFINCSVSTHHPPMALFRSRYYPVGASDGSLFGVSAGYGKVGVVPRSIHLTSKNIIFGFMVTIFLIKGCIIFNHESLIQRRVLFFIKDDKN